MKSPLVNSILPSPYCDSDKRDIALGSYMSEWGNLEYQLIILFHILLETKLHVSITLFATGFQTKTFVDLLKSLGKFKLSNSEQSQLKALCKRFNALALKRNKIVHGRWSTESIDEASTDKQWVRVYTPVDLNTFMQIYIGTHCCPVEIT